MNSTEWEITIYLHDFDESWMRYGLGRGSDIKNSELSFSRYHTLIFSGAPLMTYENLLYRVKMKKKWPALKGNFRIRS